MVLYGGKIVEEGPTDDIIRAPQHPYTKLLIGSAPTLTARSSLTPTEKSQLRIELGLIEPHTLDASKHAS
jgi:peptide/nickel transport system ATP-binding protein